MPSHDSPKTQRGEGKSLNAAKVEKVVSSFNPAPHSNLGK